MSAAADALQPQLVRELLNLRGRAHPRYIMDVIVDGPKAGYDLDFNAAASSITIDFREPTFLGSAIGGDASRFASAAFSSARGVANALDDADTLSWGLLRLYYSAFYAGHAVLRLLGRSCSYLEAPHIAQIRRLATALGSPPPFAIGGGLYACTLNSAQTGLEFTQARGRVGGAHEAFWEVFDSFLSEATEEVLKNRIAPADARNVFLKLEGLRRILARGAGASWLSAVRNEIQYRHGRGVWAPPTVNRAGRGVLHRIAGQWLRDPMAIELDAPAGAELGAFVTACTFTVGLCRVVLERVAEGSAAGANSFARPALALL